LEYVLINPSLINKLESIGFKVKGNNINIKPLSDNPNSEFVLITVKSSPLYNLKQFRSTNSIDTFDGKPAFTTRENDNSTDNLLIEIQRYISSPSKFRSQKTGISIKNGHYFIYNLESNWFDF